MGPIDQKTLKEKVKYCPDTGTFTRIGNLANNACGFINEHGYIVISVCGKQYYAHRLAWIFMTGDWPIDEVDHINNIRSDNRWCNLRNADKRLNMQNIHSARKDSTIGLKGVKRKRNSFVARIRADGIDHYLGTFKTPELAHDAYVKAKRHYHPGAFA